MSGTDVFWVFLILTFLQPVIRQRMLESARKQFLRRLEIERGSRVIAVVHRQESMSVLGLPVLRYIDMEDSESILRAIRMTAPDMPIDLILHTPGGVQLATDQVAHALRRHPAKVTVFIPHYAMSGAALLAFAADEIVMTQNAVIGALDPQIGGYPAASILKAVEAKPVARIEDQTLVWADNARKAIQQTRETLMGVLRPRMDDDKAAAIADFLTSGRWTLDYPVSVEELADMDIQVSTEMPADVLVVMNLYPQPSFGRPSVDFIPAPYHLPELPQKGAI